MLKTPLLGSDPALLPLLDGTPKELEPGVVQLLHFSLDILIWGQNAPETYMGWPKIEGLPNSYGVCDTPAQFLARFRSLLHGDKRTFVISFTHIQKELDNRGKGGGWRWRKWGPYLGEGEPTREYLDDEKLFAEGVYCYHVYQTAGPNLNKR